MKPVIYENIACLDARNLTEEKAASIRAIRNVGTLFVSEASAPLLNRIPMEGVASIAVLPNGARCLSVNGQHTLSACDHATQLYLMINGQLLMDPSLTPDQITRAVVGGKINGQMIGSASQMLALNATGIQLNGQSVTYPDGYRLRRGHAPFTKSECSLLAHGTSLCLCKGTELELGTAELLRERCIKLAVTGKIFVHEIDLSAMAEIYAGDTGLCVVIPDGYTLCEDGLTLTRRNIAARRGKFFVHGDLLGEPDAFAFAKSLEDIRVTGKAYVPLADMDGWLSVVSGQPEWMPYEGCLLTNQNTLDLDESALTQPVAILNHGVLTLDASLSAETLADRVTLLENNGVVKARQAQLSALRSVLCGSGATVAAEASATESSDLPHRETDCLYISSVATYEL